MFRRRWFAVAVSTILATAGCSTELLIRQPISGLVTLDGKPLAAGMILFYPVKGNDLNILVNGGAMIKDGYFSIPRAAGLIPARYNVVISGPEPNRRRRADRREPARDDVVAKEVIPARYNSESNLTVEITHNAIKELTFHLDSH